MMKAIKKDYTVPCTIVCKMQMEGVIASNSLAGTGVMHNAGTQQDTNIPIVGGDEVVSGGDDGDLDAAKKNNLFYDEE